MGMNAKIPAIRTVAVRIVGITSLFNILRDFKLILKHYDGKNYKFGRVISYRITELSITVSTFCI